MSPPYVTGVTFKNNRIVLTIRVDNFQPGESLEISGQATQNGGGYADFYDNNKVVPKPNPDGTAYIYVEATPSQAFENGSEVTVVLRAAKVWVTVLGESPPESGSIGHAAPVDGFTWGYIQATWPPDDDEASAGNEASFPVK